MSDQELERIEGAVSAVIFQIWVSRNSVPTGYTGANFQEGLASKVLPFLHLVVGPMAGTAPGEYLSIQGRWTRHPVYGPQMKAEIVDRRLPQSMKEIFHYPPAL